MEQQLKQRLVGVTVIFSLAVIFLPMLLDGSGNRPKHLKIDMPESREITSYEIVEEKMLELKQEVDQFPEPEAVIVDEISESSEAAEKVVVNVTEPVAPVKPDEAKKPPAKPEVAVVKPAVVKPVAKPLPEIKKTVVKKQPGGSSWVVQIGSYSDKSKAYRQRDKLRKSALAAVFIEKYKHDGLLSYRVRMGPFISKAKARVIVNKVRAKYNLKSILMRYEK